MKLFDSRRAAFEMVVRISVAVSFLALSGCAPKDSGGSAAGVPKTAAETAATAAKPTAVAVDYSKIKGRWLRIDGGYVLAINAVDGDGRAEAAYFNPNPIKVAWGKVVNEGAVLKVNVELRDVNYPGCLYKLSYMPATDRLVGTYFQAQQQQTYDVEFAREPAR